MAWNLDKDILQSGLPEIGICVPHTGSVHMHFVEKTYGPLRFEPVSWCNKTPYLSFGPPIDVARNQLVKIALDAGMDYLFFLDSDIIPRSPPDINMALHMLYSMHAPIVTGLYRAKKSYGYYWAVWLKPKKGRGYNPIENAVPKLFKADVAGLGCTLIHREVFETIPEPWFKWNTMKSYSEDFYFFRKAKKYGFDLLVRGDIRFDHMGTFILAGTEEQEVILPNDIFG